MSEKPFGSWNLPAEMALAMGADPRPFLTEEQIKSEADGRGMTVEEWNRAMDEVAAKKSKAPF